MWNFILKNGLLGFGLPLGLLFWGICLPLLDMMLRWGSEFHLLRSAFLLTLSLILFPIAGIVWGYCMWIFLEKAYWEDKASALALERDRSRNAN
ncbi:MAG: hypothetical protein RL759_83 [Verrucomicrobiota bacterium]